MAKAQIAGKLLSKLGGLFQKPLVGEALYSGGINTAIMTLGGASPGEALLYGGADALASGASLGLVRKLRGSAPVRKVLGDLGTQTVNKGGKMVTTPMRSKLEAPINIAASFASTVPVSLLLGAEQGAQGAQTKQLEQQPVQRAVVNNAPDQLAGPYMPETLLQNIGLPAGSFFLEQITSDPGP